MGGGGSAESVQERVPDGGMGTSQAGTVKASNGMLLCKSRVAGLNQRRSAQALTKTAMERPLTSAQGTQRTAHAETQRTLMCGSAQGRTTHVQCDASDVNLARDCAQCARLQSDAISKFPRSINKPYLDRGPNLMN